MKDNIILIGLMGAGKTSVGKVLADNLSKVFIDFDAEIEIQESMKISEIFSRFGEGYFRNLEKNIIFRNYENSVIATGGGIVKDVGNIKKLKEKGKIFYLYASPEVLFERIKNERHRPLLNCPNPYFELLRIYEERKGNYELADYKINTENKDITSISKEIYEKFKS